MTMSASGGGARSASAALLIIGIIHYTTTTGVNELVVVPLPSWPDSLSPQHSTVPVVTTTRPLQDRSVLTACTAWGGARGRTSRAT
jgi:hypothetical protein